MPLDERLVTRWTRERWEWETKVNSKASQELNLKSQVDETAYQ